MKLHMNLQCLLLNGLNALALYRGDDLVGYVWPGEYGEEFILRPYKGAFEEFSLTASEMLTILECWNEMQEQRLKMSRERLDKISKDAKI